MSNNKEKKIYSFHSIKGGVGKTTLAFGLYMNLSMEGKTGLFIDFDLWGTNISNLFKQKNKKNCLVNLLKINPYAFDAKITSSFKLNDFCKDKISLDNEGSYLWFRYLPSYNHSKDTKENEDNLNHFSVYSIRKELSDFVGKRIKNIIKGIFKNNSFDFIILDNHPGRHEMDKIIQEILIDDEINASYNSKIIHVYTNDLPDYTANQDLFYKLKKELKDKKISCHKFLINKEKTRQIDASKIDIPKAKDDRIAVPVGQKMKEKEQQFDKTIPKSEVVNKESLTGGQKTTPTDLPINLKENFEKNIRTKKIEEDGIFQDD